MSEREKTCACRVLIVDDNEEIHRDFRSILAPDPGGAGNGALDELEGMLLSDQTPAPTCWAGKTYELVSAYQGQEAGALVAGALRDGRPFALAFVDMRMPPGWDGVQTIRALWEMDEDLQVVLCTAYSDYDWQAIQGQLGHSENLYVLKKPFEAIEVIQMATALTRKRSIQIANVEHISELDERLKLQQSQLIQAEKMAALGQLAAGVAHEINTPIGFVASNLGTMAEYWKDVRPLLERYLELESAGAEAGGAVARIAAETARVRRDIDLEFVLDDVPHLFAESTEGIERVAEVVRDLANYALLDRTRTTTCDLTDAVRHCLKILAPRVPGNCRVRESLEQTGEVGCDLADVNQLFTNLYVNALQALAEGGRVTVTTRRVGDRAELVIADDGAGIPEEIRERIFDPFFTTKEVGAGTGLGLTIARSLARAAGGDLTIESRPGRGTRVTVKLPLHVEGGSSSMALTRAAGPAE